MTGKKLYDVIVIGVGSMGAATCLYLARQGVNVLGLEQFSISHDRGSHTGQSRLIRKSYFEHPNYVPLLTRAYEWWQQIEKETEAPLFFQTGITYFGDDDDTMLCGVETSGNKYHIPLKNFTATEVREGSTPFHFSKTTRAIFEPEAGFVLPEKSISVFSESAIKLGADLISRVRVQDWQKKDNAFEVLTDRGKFVGKKLVFTAGAWTNKLVPHLLGRLQVTQQTLAWFNPHDWAPFLLDKFPCWMYSNPNGGTFYGFPILPANDFYGPLGLKIAYHAQGVPVDPEARDDSDSSDDLEILRGFVAQHLPTAGSILSVKTCLYTYSSDEHFYIDYIPGYEGQVAIGCGFSGHGFKFAPVIGEILGDLVIKGRTDLPIDFLRFR